MVAASTSARTRRNRRRGKSAEVATIRTKLTPGQLARQWGISVEKVLRWVKSGELRAVNAASRPSGRPRFLIDLADVAVFEARRAVASSPDANPVKRRRTQNGDVIEFF